MPESVLAVHWRRIQRGGVVVGAVVGTAAAVRGCVVLTCSCCMVSSLLQNWTRVHVVDIKSKTASFSMQKVGEVKELG